MSPSSRFFFALCDVGPIPNMNSTDDQYAVVRLDLALDFRSKESISCRNPARLQRAA